MRAALAIVLAAALVPACGGKDDRLSYPEFQAQASAICLRYRRSLAKLGPPTTLPRIAKVAHAAAGLGRTERRRLARLRAPADAADGLARMLDGFGEADALLPAVRRAARRRQVGAARKLLHRGRVTVIAANEEAVRIGLSDCRRS
jgi:hypothetical protein